MRYANHFAPKAVGVFPALGRELERNRGAAVLEPPAQLEDEIAAFEREGDGEVERVGTKLQGVEADHLATLVGRDRGVERARARQAGGRDQADRGQGEA